VGLQQNLKSPLCGSPHGQRQLRLWRVGSTSKRSSRLWVFMAPPPHRHVRSAAARAPTRSSTAGNRAAASMPSRRESRGCRSACLCRARCGCVSARDSPARHAVPCRHRYSGYRPFPCSWPRWSGLPNSTSSPGSAGYHAPGRARRRAQPLFGKTVGCRPHLETESTSPARAQRGIGFRPLYR
jgi:hypothetical protein